MKKDDIISRIESANKRNGGTSKVYGMSVVNSYINEAGSEVDCFEDIKSVGYDSDELCAIGDELVYPLHELTKRELEELYKQMEKKNRGRYGNKDKRN